jgi:hypothetical protein
MADAGDKRKSLRKGSPPGRRARENLQKAEIDVNTMSQLLQEIMGRFAAAISVVVVCHRSLDAQSLAAIGDEEETLRRAIRLLKDVYNEVDLLSLATAKPRRPPSGLPARAPSGSPALQALKTA